MVVGELCMTKKKKDEKKNKIEVSHLVFLTLREVSGMYTGDLAME